MITDTTLSGEAAMKRFDHVSVRLDHYIVVFGGKWFRNGQLSLNVIWMYNLYTEQWRKHGIPAHTMAPPPTYEACAAVIDMDIYMFGGNSTGTLTNALWKLSKTPHACFEWSEIKTPGKAKSPSPRSQHSGWEYDGKLWTFGGSGQSPIGFLNHNGDYDVKDKLNNQLLCFDPTFKDWTNPKCCGSIPPHVAAHAITIIMDNVWQFGGYKSDSDISFHELYELNMPSLSWTKIEAGYPQPYQGSFCSFTALTNTYLLLHGLFTLNKNHYTCILDISTLTWKEFKFDKSAA